MPGVRFTREVLHLHAKPVGQSKREAKEMSARAVLRPCTKTAGLLDSNDGVFSRWMHQIGERDIGLNSDEQLGLEEGPVAFRVCGQPLARGTWVLTRTTHLFTILHHRPKVARAAGPQNGGTRFFTYTLPTI
jgi:hypothetical protein